MSILKVQLKKIQVGPETLSKFLDYLLRDMRLKL